MSVRPGLVTVSGMRDIAVAKASSPQIQRIVANSRAGIAIGLHGCELPARFGDAVRALLEQRGFALSDLQDTDIPGIVRQINLDQRCRKQAALRPDDFFAIDHKTRAEKCSFYSNVRFITSDYSNIDTSKLHRIKNVISRSGSIIKEELIEEFMILGDQDRIVRVAEGKIFKNPHFYFTTFDHIMQCENAVGHDPLVDVAVTACASLGLGHFRQGDWVIRFDVPSQVIDLVGHYRPSFQDGAGFEWFMAGSRARPWDPEPWGQTVQLPPDPQGITFGDGGPERVCFGLTRDDFRTATAALTEADREFYNLADGEELGMTISLIGQVTRDMGPSVQLAEFTRLLNADRRR